MNVENAAGMRKQDLLFAILQAQTANRGKIFAEGVLEMHGQNLLDRKIDVVDMRRRIGMVFQRPNPLPLSVQENIIFGYRLAMGQGKVTSDQRDEIVEKALRQVLLWDTVKDRLTRKATELSLEEQQKLCIARLLPVKPSVLLMDEPCSALDPKGTEAVEELIWDDDVARLIGLLQAAAGAEAEFDGRSERYPDRRA